MRRCEWCGNDPLYQAYHDAEWGVPEYDSRALWEKLVLDGFQAGLSWITILRKRDRFRAAFEGFEPRRIATWGEADVLRLLADPGIVRHRGKIEAAIGNARVWCEIEAEIGFDRFLWDYFDGHPRQNAFADATAVPAETDTSRRISADLKRRGFRFCGPTITYAFLQASGFVNDHVTSCFRHAEIAAMVR
ncbi:DNA-3-methyladenine glycosylase I [Palleronia aestuarii]|uniref:DNA-3-methyladenine glycosylase I n=1 Tax=Palleronia aestuarii TaxID=568105 RepID=A0A2W7N9A0_9RHOB|nr:DNA-3-methyladenine glycosylase I [Palleronia aestuarii]PZX16610.1 DNA-3-methyladenine glycosylase I [Palleronia aestuarii]